MIRRLNYGMAEKVSLALLTRAAFGAKAGTRTALRVGVPDRLIKKIFARPLFLTRIDIAGAAGSIDRRRPRPQNELK